VDSVDLSGNPIDGLWTVIQNGGNTVATGYTPLAYTATVNSTYTVSVSNYGSYTFSHWNTGATTSTITVTPTSNLTLTAYYNTPAPPPPPANGTAVITVETVNLSGTEFSGIWTVIQSNGAVLATGYSTLTFTASIGVTYQISVANYGSYTFAHWADSSTSPTYTLTVTANTTLVAYYNTP
jgi:hypothetical protein